MTVFLQGLFLVGLVIAAYGFWMWYKPLGVVIFGLLLSVLCWLAAIDEIKKKRQDQQ